MPEDQIPVQSKDPYEPTKRSKMTNDEAKETDTAAEMESELSEVEIILISRQGQKRKQVAKTR